MTLEFLSWSPPAPLHHVIESIWDFRAAARPHALERVLPVPGAGLIFNLAEDQTRVYDEAFECFRFSAMTLDGPRTCGQIIDTAEQVAVMGVVFRSGGASLFFRERLDRLLNDSVDLEALVGCTAALLREQLLEARSARRRLALLLRWLQQRGTALQPCSALQHALCTLDATPRIDALAATARELGWSPRTLGERFRQQVGMSPKRYLRLRRFQQVLGATTNPDQRVDWAGLAVDCGYHDQAHLAHEFREFSGLSPTAYHRQRTPWSSHVAVC